jgi:GTP-dependent dephospho-CoA kinase
MSGDNPISGKLRVELKSPLGLIIPDADVTSESVSPYFSSAKTTVTVGDRKTERFQEFGFSPSLEIVDSLEKRAQRIAPKILQNEKRSILSATNPAGYITTDALEKIALSLKLLSSSTKVRLEIKGEEDLLALPVIAFFPQKTATFYGQPNVGMVVIATRESRERARSILHTMGIDSLPQV